MLFLTFLPGVAATGLAPRYGSEWEVARLGCHTSLFLSPGCHSSVPTLLFKLFRIKMYTRVVSDKTVGVNPLFLYPSTRARPARLFHQRCF